MMIDLFQEYGLLITGVLVAGFASGYAGGLFGIGGGIITVPALYAIFNAVGVSDGASFKTAVGTSLGVIIVTSIRSLMAHHDAGHVDFPLLKGWGPWIAIGAVISGFLARWAPVELLTMIFAGGALYIAWRRLFLKEKNNPQRKSVSLDKIKIPVGVGTGLFSALMGLGGGGLGVIIMTMAGRSMHRAIGTSAGFGIAVAVPGVAGFVVSGWSQNGLPPISLGFVNIPAFVIMASMAAISAPLGARMAHRVDGAILSKLFGGYVLIAAISLMVDVFVA